MSDLSTEPPVPPPPLLIAARPSRLPPIIAIISLFMAIAISADVLWKGRLNHLDPLIARRIYVYMMDSPSLVRLCAWITSLGGLTFSLTAGGTVAAILLVFSRWRLLTIWVIGLGGSALINGVMKPLFALRRPDVLAQLDPGPGFTYPSGHAMAALMTFGLSAYILTREMPRGKWLWITLCTLLVAVVSGSLLLIGVHYLTDILGALSLGMGWMFLLIAAAGTIKSRSGESP